MVLKTIMCSTTTLIALFAIVDISYAYFVSSYGDNPYIKFFGSVGDARGLALNDFFAAGLLTSGFTGLMIAFMGFNAAQKSRYCVLKLLWVAMCLSVLQAQGPLSRPGGLFIDMEFYIGNAINLVGGYLFLKGSTGVLKTSDTSAYPKNLNEIGMSLQAIMFAGSFFYMFVFGDGFKINFVGESNPTVQSYAMQAWLSIGFIKLILENSFFLRYTGSNNACVAATHSLLGSGLSIYLLFKHKSIIRPDAFLGWLGTNTLFACLALLSYVGKARGKHAKID